MGTTSKVFVITGPSGVGKGTLIRGLLERMPELELSVSATTRDPRPGESDGVDYHFLTPEQFEARVDAGDFVEHANYSGNRYGTLRSELERRLAAGAGVVLEIEVQGARQVRSAMPDAVAVFIAPPSESALRVRLVGRGTDSPEQVDAAAAHRRAGARGAARVRARGRQRPARAGDRRARRDRPSVDGLLAARGPVPRLRTCGPGWVPPLTCCQHSSGKDGPALISPRIDKLLEHVDSDYASVIVAAKRARQINSYYHNLGEGTFDEFPPPMVETRSKNYLTIALEEVAQGKLKYHYR